MCAISLCSTDGSQTDLTLLLCSFLVPCPKQRTGSKSGFFFFFWWGFTTMLKHLVLSKNKNKISFLFKKSIEIYSLIQDMI